ncbi:MAG: hypothetical protein JOZ75_07020 [Candidatus Dormibacteraeota bacterium]|nr:hypothetical protein [Candidatus Dormibacteraeota bacterium]
MITRTFDAATPWLLDLGTWIFGALIGFDLLMLAALLTVGPADRAVLISTAAFAVGLPPEVGAFVLLRLVRDLEATKIEEVAARSMAEAGLEHSMPAVLADSQRTAQRTAAALGVSYGLLFVSILSALTGLTATLWHMGWWIAVAFLAVVTITQPLMFAVILRSPPRAGASAGAHPAAPTDHPATEP